VRPQIGREHEHDDDINDEELDSDTEVIMKTTTTLGDRPMAGRLALDQQIGVRVPVPEPVAEEIHAVDLFSQDDGSEGPKSTFETAAFATCAPRMAGVSGAGGGCAIFDNRTATTTWGVPDTPSPTLA
jgi:hypothetical protein